MSFLKRIGQALLIPLQIFPVITIFMSLGQLCHKSHYQLVKFIGFLIQSSGSIFVDNLPLIFSVCIAYYFAREKNYVAGILGVVSYTTIIYLINYHVISSFVDYLNINIPIESFFYINNQFVGILTGILSASIYNRVYSAYVDFINQTINTLKILLITFIMAVLLSFVLLLLWPFIYSLLYNLGCLLSKMGPIGAGIYGFLNRLLILFGLHHPLNSIFWFDIIGINDMSNFWNSTGTLGVTGMYQAGYFPIFMFGLPAASLAIYRKNDGQISKHFLKTASLSSFLNGISEPLEFTFISQIPMLYFIHCLLSGLSMFLCARLRITVGFGFSAGLIDYLLGCSMPLAHYPLAILGIGIIMAVLYYISFSYFMPTLSQESKNEIDVHQTIESLGGFTNLEDYYACTTRLHFFIKNMKIVDIDCLKNQGYLDVKKMNNCIILVIGSDVDDYYYKIKNLQKDC